MCGNFKLVSVLSKIAEHLVVEKIQNGKTSRPLTIHPYQWMNGKKKFANLSFKIGRVKSDQF